MTNTENLFEMVYLLLDKKKMTARELSEHFGVSVRTIYRWIDSLCVAGIPLFSTKGFGGGIEIDEHYALDKTVLTEDEKISILAAVNAFTVLSGENSPEKSAANKIAALSNADTNWLEIDFCTWNPLGAYVRTVFDVAKSAILKRQQLKFDYYSIQGDHGERTIQPWKIVFRGQAWYLYGWCNLKKEERFFKLSRIQNIKNTGKLITVTEQSVQAGIKAQRPQAYEQKLAKEYKLIEVTVKVPVEAAYRIMDDFKVTVKEKSNSGTNNYVIISFQMPDEYWLISYLLSFGLRMEVIAPAHIKTALETEIQCMYKKIGENNA